MKEHRTVVPALEEILGKEFHLMDRGCIRVVDYMGGDESIVQAARVSYGKGTTTVRKDEGLIRYLMRHRHTTPFEMCEIKLHVKVPIYVWRQWIRHRTASVNEVSGRYSLIDNVMVETRSGAWREQARRNRQGSEGTLPSDTGEELTKKERELQVLAYETYMDRIVSGVAREQARKDLPLSTYTEAYWKTNLHNLLHFLELRMDDHAQEEIRFYANIIGKEIVRLWCPMVWKAFLDYRLKKVELSEPEQHMLQIKLNGEVGQAYEFAMQIGWLTHEGSKLKYSREMKEYIEKLKSLGFKSDWDDLGV